MLFRSQGDVGDALLGKGTAGELLAVHVDGQILGKGGLDREKQGKQKADW